MFCRHIIAFKRKLSQHNLLILFDLRSYQCLFYWPQGQCYQTYYSCNLQMAGGQKSCQIYYHCFVPILQSFCKDKREVKSTDIQPISCLF